MGIKKRITFLFAAASVTLFGVSSVVAYVIIENHLHAQARASLDESLRHESLHLRDNFHFHGVGALGKDIYVRITQNGVMVHDSLPKALNAESEKPDSPNLLVKEVVIPHKEDRVTMTGYFDLGPTQQLLKDFRNTLLMGNLALLILGIPLGLWFTHVSLRPFRQLAQRTSRLDAGDLSFRFDTPSVQDEYGTLTENFNGLLSRLEQAFASVTQFAGRASHELRTPVTAIAGHAEVALRGKKSETDLREALETVLLRSRSLQELLNRLLLLSRLAHAQPSAIPRAIPLAKKVNETFLLFQQARRREDATLSTEGNRAEVWDFNEELFSIAVSNAIDNGVKFCRSQVLVRWTEGDSERALEVHDDGPGVEREKREAMLQPFQRGEGSTGEGAGLGLSLATQAMTAMGGRLELDSSVLGGLQVRLWFPPASAT